MPGLTEVNNLMRWALLLSLFYKGKHIAFIFKNGLFLYLLNFKRKNI